MEHLRDLPYELHTNNELKFMLERGKPMAAFCIEYPNAFPPDLCEQIIPEKAFAPYVADGTLERRELVEPLAKPLPNHPHIRGTRRVFYAVPHEAWRIDAYIMLLDASAAAGWNEGFERLEGSLLGYEHWQTDIWLARLRTSDHTRDWYWLRR